MIRFHDLHKRFGSVVAVDGLSLDIHRGEAFGLLGPNGAGKTTTVNLAIGLLEPDQERVELDGLGPPTRAEVRAQIGVAPQALACFIATASVSVALFAIARLAFGVRPGSLPLLALAIVSASLAFVGIMMFLSVLGRTEQAAGGISWAILLVMAMLGGGMIPLFAMPGWMQRLSHLSPIKWAVLALEGAIRRGFSFEEMLLPYGILLAVGTTCFIVGVRAFRWME